MRGWTLRSATLAAKRKEYYSVGTTSAQRCVFHPLIAETTLAKPPNFKQEKQRREAMQKKKNLEKQREQAARKENPAPLPKP